MISSVELKRKEPQTDHKEEITKTAPAVTVKSTTPDSKVPLDEGSSVDFVTRGKGKESSPSESSDSSYDPEKDFEMVDRPGDDQWVNAPKELSEVEKQRKTSDSDKSPSSADQKTSVVKDYKPKVTGVDERDQADIMGKMERRTAIDSSSSSSDSEGDEGVKKDSKPETKDVKPSKTESKPDKVTIVESDTSSKSKEPKSVVTEQLSKSEPSEVPDGARVTKERKSSSSSSESEDGTSVDPKSAEPPLAVYKPAEQDVKKLRSELRQPSFDQAFDDVTPTLPDAEVEKELAVAPSIPESPSKEDLSSSDEEGGKKGEKERKSSSSSSSSGSESDREELFIRGGSVERSERFEIVDDKEKTYKSPAAEATAAAATGAQKEEEVMPEKSRQQETGARPTLQKRLSIQQQEGNT